MGRKNKKRFFSALLLNHLHSAVESEEKDLLLGELVHEPGGPFQRRKCRVFFEPSSQPFGSHQQKLTYQNNSSVTLPCDEI